MRQQIACGCVYRDGMRIYACHTSEHISEEREQLLAEMRHWRTQCESAEGQLRELTRDIDVSRVDVAEAEARKLREQIDAMAAAVPDRDHTILHLQREKLLKRCDNLTTVLKVLLKESMITLGVYQETARCGGIEVVPVVVRDLLTAIERAEAVLR